MKTIGILHGPNLNALGTRQPHIYGNQTLKDLELYLEKMAASLDCKLLCVQSNHEGILIDTLYDWKQQLVFGCILNPGAYAHTSLALQDTLLACQLPCVEVHLSNVHDREPVRHQLLSGAKAIGVISGLGFKGYAYALQFLIEYTKKNI